MKRKKEKCEHFWIKFDIGQYKKRTCRLRTAAEHGVYMLLMMAYRSNGPFHDDDRILASTAQMGAVQWGKMAHLMRSFFSKGTDGLLHQREWDEDIAEANYISTARKLAAAQRKPKPAEEPKPVVANGANPEEKFGGMFDEQLGPDKRFSLAQIEGNRGQLMLGQYAGVQREIGGDPSGRKRVYAGVRGHNMVCLAKAIRLLAEAAGKDRSWRTDWQVLVDWLNEGIELETILAAVKQAEERHRAGDGVIYSMRYFNQEVRTLHRKKAHRSAA